MAKVKADRLSRIRSGRASIATATTRRFFKKICEILTCRNGPRQYASNNPNYRACDFYTMIWNLDKDYDKEYFKW